MGFEKISRTRSTTGDGVHAFLRVAKNNKGGNLRLTTEGITELHNNGINYGAGMKLDIFFDSDSGKLALQHAPEGEFKLTKNSAKGNSLRITSADLAKRINKNTDYRMEFNLPDFDAVLVPIKSKDEPIEVPFG